MNRTTYSTRRGRGKAPGTIPKRRTPLNSDERGGRRAIDSIKIGPRHRRDMGDIKALAASIQEMGLLHAIVVTKDNTLVAGERRLAACKLLGQTDVAVRVVDLDQIIRGELAENADRKDFTLSEFVAIRRAHSQKPIEFYNFVETLCPAPRYADIFSRYQHSERWDCHGDEAPVAKSA